MGLPEGTADCLRGNDIQECKGWASEGPCLNVWKAAIRDELILRLKCCQFIESTAAVPLTQATLQVL